MGWFDRQRMWGSVLLLTAAALVLSACVGESISAPVASDTPPPTIDELATLIAMQQVATEVPTATPFPTHTPTSSPTVTPPPTATPLPTATIPPSVYPTNTPRDTGTANPAATPTGTPAAVAGVSSADWTDHYWLARPFPRDPDVVDYASRSYPYGSTGGGQFAPHHGVDIPNSPGTAILAVADGWVVYAGNDKQELYGPSLNFYGYLVVIEHDRPAPNGQPLYTLYGHMLRVDVETGQRVKLLDKIGEVGATGVALGPHLHFEVRIGDPRSYEATTNPDLWLRPWPGFGTLAGTITDRNGKPLYEATITIEPVGDGPDRYANSYATNSIGSDPILGEDYARGDLPAGEYHVFVRVRNILRFETITTIEDGKTTVLNIVLR